MTFDLDISVLELESLDTRDALGEQAAAGLLKLLYGDQDAVN
jgi:hypothetical protein